jgi:hypothetical protein
MDWNQIRDFLEDDETCGSTVTVWRKRGGGIQTRDGLLGRYLALSGVAALVDRGAKAVQLSTRQIALLTPFWTIWGLKG